MSPSMIAILILIVTILLFVTERIPLCLTAMLSAISMGLFGIIGWPDVFSGMSNNIVPFLIGCGILGAAYFSTGLADKLSRLLLRRGKHLSEKRLILVFYIIGAVTSAFFNGAMIVAVLFPIIDALSKDSEGRITRKHLYLPTAVSTVFGSNITTIGSTSMLLSIGMLADSDAGVHLSLFDPFLVGLPGIIVGLLIYTTFGLSMQKRIFTYPDLPSDVDVPQFDATISKGFSKHQWITILTTICCITSVVLGLNYGASGMIAASVLIITGCIDLKHAFRSVSWDMIFMVAGSLGIAQGLKMSGAAELIAASMLNAFSFLSDSPAGFCVMILFLSTMLSNFMSNGATVSIVVPFALSLAQSLSTAPAPFVLAAAIGANLSVATPICVTQIIMSLSAGYNFRSLLKMGGFLNLIAFLTTALAFLLVYYF